MKVKVIIMLLTIGFSSFDCALRNSLTLCPNEDLANNLVGAARVDAPAQKSTGLVRRIRLPEFGLYNHYLNCILVTDTSYEDGNDAIAEVTDGGLNHKYVEIKFTSEIGKGLEFAVLAYTNRESVNLNSTKV